MSLGTVTIVVPTYKRPDKLKRAVQSVLDQTYEDVRILISDNASNDRTEEIAAALVAKDRRVEYFCHSHNVGLIKNVNSAYARVTTPFLGILPDDDYYLPNFIRDAMSAFETYPQIKISVLSAPTVDELGNFLSDQLSPWPKAGLYLPGESILTAVNGHQPIITTCIFRSELVDELYYDEGADSVADIPVLITLLAKYPFHLSKAIGGYFIKHAGASGSTFATKGNVRGICPAFTRVEECLRDNPTIEAQIKGRITQALARRIDKIFFELMLVNVLANDAEAVSFMRQKIYERRSELSIWRIGGTLLGRLSVIFGLSFVSACLSLVRRLIRQLRQMRSTRGHLF